MSVYTNTDLIEDIKTIASIPENSNTTDQNILDLATKVVRNIIAPALMKIKEEYFVFDISYSITQNQSKYRISSRAIGGSLRDVTLQDSAGSIKSIPNIEPEQVTTTATGTPNSFYLKGSNIVLYPTPSTTTGTLNGNILIRPNKLTEVANTACITAIDTNTNQLTVDNLPASWTAATIVDFVKGSSPFEILAIDYSISSASGSTITFTSLPSTLEVGDYVALKEFSPIPNLPEDLFPALVKLAAAEWLVSIGQNDEAGVVKAEGVEGLNLHLSTLKPRVVGASKKFKTRLI